MEEELFGSSDDESDKRSAASDASDAEVNNGQSVRQSDDEEGKVSRSPSPSASGSAASASPALTDGEPAEANDDGQHSDEQEEENHKQQSDDERSEDGEAAADREEVSDGEQSAHSEEPEEAGSAEEQHEQSADEAEAGGSEAEDGKAAESASDAEAEDGNGKAAESGSDAEDGKAAESASEAEEAKAAESASDAEEGKLAESESEAEAEGSPRQEVEEGSARESGSEDEASNKRKRSDAEGEDESRSPQRESGSEKEESVKKKPKIASDNEDDDKNAIAADLFGEADDISSDSDGEKKERPVDIDPLANLSPEPEHDMDDDDDKELQQSPAPAAEEEDAEPEPVPEEIPETRIDVEIPKITTDLGKELHFVKLPNFLSVETRPFDHQSYEDEIDDDEVLDEEGRARLKLKVENTIRWRWGYDKEGNLVKESNVRAVKWSDGSMSLHLGSEIFDVHKQLLQGDHNHMFIRQGTGLQGQAVFRTKLTFRPHSTDSFTHRKITMSVADRSQKTQKIRILPNVGADPEAHRSEMIKKEEDKLKASIRRENKQRRMKERALSRGLTSSYLEPDRYDDDEEDDDGAISLAAIKNKYKKGVRELRPAIYSSESDASDIDDRGARRLERAKALADSDDERGNKDSDEQPSGSEGQKKRVARIEDSDED